MLVDKVTASTQPVLGQYVWQQQYAFPVDSIHNIPEHCFRCLVPDSSQSLRQLRTKFGAHDMFVKVISESLNSIFISELKIIHIMVQVTRHCARVMCESIPKLFHQHCLS